MSDAQPDAKPNADTNASEYRGYRIAVMPHQDHDDLWDFDYTVTPVDGKGETRQRSNTAGGHASADIAMQAGIEVARTEIDNLLALQA